MDAEHEDPKVAKGYSVAELRAIATRALAGGDTYSRELLRSQLLREEFRVTRDSEVDP